MPKYKTKIRDCELVVSAKFASSEKVNERELDFFCRKCIRGLLKAKPVQRLFFKGLEYSGPKAVSLVERLKKPTCRYDFFFMMEQIVDIAEKIQHNGLLLQKIDWDIHNVYINETTREMQFIYLPLEKMNGTPDILSFMESIIYSTNFSDGNTDYVSEFTYFIKGMKRFDPEKVEQYIRTKESGVVNIIKKSNEEKSDFMTDKPQDYYAHYSDKEEATSLLMEEEATALLVEEEEEATVLLNDEEATGTLNEEDEAENINVHYPSLFRTATNETVLINKPVFRIGKEISSSDYTISDNGAVSRSHADIVTRGTRCFVIDLNSKNRTYINDNPIPSKQEMELHDGDHLRLADEDFVFAE